MPAEAVPFFSFEPMHQAIRAEVLEAMAACFDSNWYVLGRQVADFEQTYAAWNGVEHAVGVASGLDALIIALRALGAGPGREVIVPSNAYVACWLAVAATGATVVPAEPDPATHNLDATQVAAAISPRTLAVMPVHLFGQACHMPPLLQLAERNGFFVVEDNAQAHGARSAGQLTGSIGHLNATSFYPTKNLGALGDGGAITTNHSQWARFARAYRNYGSEVKYFNQYAGVNSRLDELQAAVLLVKLRQLERWNAERQALAAQYLKHLQPLSALQLPVVASGCTHVWHLFVVQCAERDALQKFLTQQRIQTMIHYPVPPHLQDAFAPLGYRNGQFPVAEQLAAQSLSLPLFPGMRPQQLEYVCAAIRAFFGNP
ncbi:MAG: DegT/DnrJ/EryC1/StrS family aminotransferase [Saprospirales bacterium]|nr:DegT/DnrJ/EryC1/StrS family aminotransferase [Saprospirales bacterium]MBK8923568.1 DegT/DnrJ/EryC1/StrS family aminotransferase [Saprospirales bacterium]